MKKLSKVTMFLITLLMVLSLFAACGDEKKDESSKDEKAASEIKDNNKADSNLTGKDLLIGDWEAEAGLAQALLFSFKQDGTVQTTYTREYYDRYIDVVLEDFNGSSEEIRDYLEYFPTYEEFAELLDYSGVWELVGDTLTVKLEGEEPLVAETKLSEGKTSFAFTYGDGYSTNLTKIS